MNKMYVANKLKELRGQSPRRKVAKAIGISTSALAMYETGERIPRDEIKLKLANYFNVPLISIFYPTESTNSEH